MTNLAFGALDLEEKPLAILLRQSRRHTHGSDLSHLSLEILHREQDFVNLCVLAPEPEEAFELTVVFISSYMTATSRP